MDITITIPDGKYCRQGGFGVPCPLLHEEYENEGCYCQHPSSSQQILGELQDYSFQASQRGIAGTTILKESKCPYFYSC
jgi:hypothetical protein